MPDDFTPQRETLEVKGLHVLMPKLLMEGRCLRSLGAATAASPRPQNTPLGPQPAAKPTTPHMHTKPPSGTLEPDSSVEKN